MGKGIVSLQDDIMPTVWTGMLSHPCFIVYGRLLDY